MSAIDWMRYGCLWCETHLIARKRRIVPQVRDRLVELVSDGPSKPDLPSTLVFDHPSVRTPNKPRHRTYATVLATGGAVLRPR